MGQKLVLSERLERVLTQLEVVTATQVKPTGR